MISRFAKSFLIIIMALFILAMLAFLHPPSRAYIDPWTGQMFGEGGVERTFHTSQKSNSENVRPPIAGVEGGVIMPKLANATAKAALGRATWKLLHTITLRFPEDPTSDEREALSSYFYLSSRVYPCGECAAEFQKLLKEFPPQTSTRRAAALWLCDLHNRVNQRLGKPEFDCANLDSEYDCGCGDQPIHAPSTETHNTDPMDLEHDPSKDDITGAKLVKGGR